MSKRNLVTVTCSLNQSDLLEFVEKYGISMCYDPQLPSSDKPALDAPEGYIPLYISLFTISNLHLPLCGKLKGLRGEATVPLFRSFLTVGHAFDWLTFQKRHGPNIPSIFGNSMSNIPDWKSDFIFVKQTLIFDIHYGQGTFAFSYPTDSFDETMLADQPIDVGFELAVVGEGFSRQSVDVVESSKKRCLITKALEEEATVVRPVSKKRKPKGPRRTSTRGSSSPLPTTTPKSGGKHPRVLACYIGNLANVKKAHAAHNTLYNLHYPLLKDKLGFLTFDELVNVYDVHALQMAVVGNMSVAASAKDSRKKLSKEVEGLKPRVKEVELLEQRCRDLESEKDFLLKEAEKVIDLSSKLNVVDLEKAKLALDEVHGLGDSWDFKDVQDYHHEAKKIFDEAVEAFYKVKFPYISLLLERAGRSFEELAAMEPPSIQEAPSS
ncbi:hypothetical protein Tco_0188700 [Tanacetum coccineum]